MDGMERLVADNVVQATDATIRSLQRGVFARMRALGLEGYRWALPRISSSLNHKHHHEFKRALF